MSRVSKLMLRFAQWPAEDQAMGGGIQIRRPV